VSHPGNTATRYEYEGRFVVRDDQTKEILQISGDNRFRPNEIWEFLPGSTVKVKIKRNYGEDILIAYEQVDA